MRVLCSRSSSPIHLRYIETLTSVHHDQLNFPEGYAFLSFSCYPSYKQTHSLLCNGIEGLAFHTKPSSFREHMQAHAESRPHKSPLPIKSAPCHHPFHWSFHIPKTGKITEIEAESRGLLYRTEWSTMWLDPFWSLIPIGLWRLRCAIVHSGV